MRRKRFPKQITSVAEVNIGLAASCVPVIFVLFKGSTEKTFLFLTRLWNTATRRSRVRAETRAASDIPLDPYQETDENNLPGIPRAEVTGLRSFLRNIGRTKAAEYHKGQSTVMLTDLSEVNDYHDHLRNGQKVVVRYDSTV